MGKEMVDIIRKRFQKINRSLGNLSLSPGKEMDIQTIHSFRVEVKKLRAFLKMSETAGRNKSDSLKIPKGLHIFYTTLGRVRNLQLQQQRIADCINLAEEYFPQSAIPEFYLKILGDEVAVYLMKALKLTKSKGKFKREERKLIARIPAQPCKSYARKFVDGQIRRIRELLARPARVSRKSGNSGTGYGKKELPASERLHTIRKILKHLLYTWTYSKNFLGKELPFSILRNRKALDSLAVSLGDLHDRVISLELLGPPYASKLIPKNERLFLSRVRREWSTEKKRREKELFILLRKIFLESGPQL